MNALFTSLTTGAWQSVLPFVSLVRSGGLRRRFDRVGTTYRIEQAGDFRIFRETVADEIKRNRPVVLVVGFRLRLIRSLAPPHWLFRRLCLVTTPFWSGYPGFRVKLWMDDPITRNYLGIYDWDGAEAAADYIRFLGPILKAVSVTDSVWHRTETGQSFEDYLAERQLPTAATTVQFASPGSTVSNC